MPPFFFVLLGKYTLSHALLVNHILQIFSIPFLPQRAPQESRQDAVRPSGPDVIYF